MLQYTRFAMSQLGYATLDIEEDRVHRHDRTFSCCYLPFTFSLSSS